MPHVSVDSLSPIEIYYEEEGSGVPIVCIGGLTSTVETWALQRKELATRYRVILPDNRGSGRTRVADDNGSREMSLFAADVLALIDELRLEQIHLVGASMGGMIVQQFALTWPERLRSLTLVCTAFGGPDMVQIDPKMSAAVLSAAEGEAESSLAAVAHPESAAKRSDAVRFYLDSKEAQPHSAEEVARRAEVVGRFDVGEAIRSMLVPTLVATGRQDLLVSPDNSRMLAERIPNAELLEIDEGGHIFFIEHAAAFNEALLSFLDRH